MGSGASMEGSYELTREQAIEIVGDAWDEDQWLEEAGSANGKVSVDRVKELVNLASGRSPASSEDSNSSSSGSESAAGKPGQEPVPSRKYSMWKNIHVDSYITSVSSVKAEELLDEAVSSMMKMLEGYEQLAEQNLEEKIQSAAMSAEDAEERHQARRARIQREAAEHVAAFEKLSPEEQLLANNQGDMDHYSVENQAKREALFDDDEAINKELDRWWRAAELYIDRDKNNRLEMQEYEIFYHRLIKIVQEDALEGEDLDADEARKLMEADFHADSGADGSVDREEFRFAVFEMADHWTDSVDADEYVEFLKRGFKIVFDDMIASGRAQMPPQWLQELKRVKVLSPLPPARLVDLITGIISDKIKADAVVRRAGKSTMPMVDYVLTYFKSKYGNESGFRKQFKGFVIGLTAMLDDETHELHDYVLLFAQMCDVTAPFGRINALPHRATDFLLAHLDGIISRASERITVKSQDASKGGIDARSKSLVSGFLSLDSTLVYMDSVLRKELDSGPTTSLYKVTMLSLTSLAIEVPGRDKHAPSRRLVQCMRLTVLLGVVYAAWDSTAARRTLHSQEDSSSEEMAAE
jgi:hypothetical protein